MTVGIDIRWRSKPLRRSIFGGAVFAVALFACASAYAVSDNVKNACRDDYFQHCSQFAVDTEELRQCMRNVGENLSTPCLVALVQDGQITKEDVERHNAAKGTSAKKKDTKKEQEVAAKDPDDPKALGTKSAKKHKTAKKGKKAKSLDAATDEPAAAKPADLKTAQTEKAADKPSDTADPAKPGTSTKQKKTGKKKSKKSKGAASDKSAPADKSAADGTAAKAPAAATDAAAPSDPKPGDAKPGSSAKKSASKKNGTAKTGTTAKTKKKAKKKTAATKPKKALDAQSP